MSRNDFGVLVMYEWYEVMDPLILSEYKKLHTAIYRFQKFGEEPPEFKGKTRAIATMIFAQLRRRTALSSYGKMGAEKRLSESKKTEEGNGLASSQASSPPESKGNKTEYKNNKTHTYPRQSADRGARGARDGGSAAKSASVDDWDEFFDNAVKNALGNA